MVRLLLSHRACTELSDKDTRTALWYAVKYEQKGVAILLRQARQAAVNEGRITEAKTKAARAKAELKTRNGNDFGGACAAAATGAISTLLLPALLFAFGAAAFFLGVFFAAFLGVFFAAFFLATFLSAAFTR